MPKSKRSKAPSKPSGRGRQRTLTLRIVAGIAAVMMVFGGVVLFQQIAQVQQGAVTPQVPEGAQLSPSLRARGAVLTIAGDDSRPDVSYDPSSGMITARFQSKYFDPKHSASLNREYLATEGRLVVQLALHNSPEASGVVAVLFHGSQELATVTGTAQQDYKQYTVQYAKGLP
jgi:hypothetical protein